MSNQMLAACLETQHKRIKRNEFKGDIKSYDVFSGWTILNSDMGKLSDVLVSLPLIDIGNKTDRDSIVQELKERAADVANMAAIIHAAADRIGIDNVR